MAYLFDDANSQYLYVDSNPVSAKPIALAAWSNSDSGSTDNQYILSGCIDGATTHFGAISYNTSGGSPDGIRAIEFDGGYDYAQTTADWSASTWHSVVGIFASDTDRRGFIDGANKVTDTSSQGFNSLDKIVIGAVYTNAYTFHFSGSIAECAIWDLSAWPGATDADKANNFEKIIPSLGKGFSPLFFPLGLKAYFPLVRNLKDIIGGLSLTASASAPTVTSHPRVIYPSEIWVVVTQGGGEPPASGTAIMTTNKGFW